LDLAFLSNRLWFIYFHLPSSYCYRYILPCQATSVKFHSCFFFFIFSSNDFLILSAAVEGNVFPHMLSFLLSTQSFTIFLSWNDFQNVNIVTYMRILLHKLPLFYSTGIWTLCFALAWQALYHFTEALDHLPLFIIFEIGSWFFFLKYWDLNSRPIPQRTLLALFGNDFFQDSVSQTICPDWLWILILLISASWIARITGVSHHCLAVCSIFTT
jgi:hypothetical protein